MMRREKRGRLSSFDLLPEEATIDLVWAQQELGEFRREQKDILAEFNQRLAAKGIGPISKSAFSRKAMVIASWQRRSRLQRDVMTAIGPDIDAKSIDESNVILGEFIKTLIAEMADDATKTPKQAMELARAYQSVVSAQKMSTEMRRQRVDTFERVVSKTIDKISTIKGFTPEMQRKLRAELFGITLPPETAKAEAAPTPASEA